MRLASSQTSPENLENCGNKADHVHPADSQPIGETDERFEGSDTCGALEKSDCKSKTDFELDSPKTEDEPSKVDAPIASATDEEDVCPTCLEADGLGVIDAVNFGLRETSLGDRTGRWSRQMEAEFYSSRTLSSSQEESGDEELSVLPRHTKVIVTGNNRTKSVLVGLQGVVKKAVGLGGWHWLVLKNGVEVKLQRNALSVLETPTGNEDDGDEFDCNNSICNSLDMGEKDVNYCEFITYSWIVVVRLAPVMSNMIHSSELFLITSLVYS
ncbi:hypothetical protein COCNU_08G010870 [Cocos nucifera]|uniref:Uncharacterized protein n=1 Tax=Cocos nucifera TaxID=13894 RepID=A0A8K0IIU3_COCNU|nr:hypothetical protein COCNU_08G010870 [Cocos nucifera]